MYIFDTICSYDRVTKCLLLTTLTTTNLTACRSMMLPSANCFDFRFHFSFRRADVSPEQQMVRQLRRILRRSAAFCGVPGDVAAKSWQEGKQVMTCK
mmetsp:Transcript_100412/g.161874  ORF Transcript_100412/g.161874 Transcript_100412/m.161874 type:complete len:97 (-) Transcript_100412:305-595(-)